jgi:hypothetical protein
VPKTLGGPRRHKISLGKRSNLQTKRNLSKEIQMNIEDEFE